MFSRAALLIATTLALSATALPHSSTENTCNTGSIQCCNDVQSVKSQKFTQTIQELGIKVEDLTGQAGFNCSPISALSITHGSKCDAKPVCCTGNNYKGLVVIGCSPIDISL